MSNKKGLNSNVSKIKMQFQVIDLKLDNQMGKISFINCPLRIQLCNVWNFTSFAFHMGTL